MDHRTVGSVVALVGFHATLVVAALLSESALTVALLLVVDVVVGVARVLFERAAAGRPAAEPPASDPYGILESLYDTVRDRRGSVRLHPRLPAVSPRNLPYVVEQWSVLLALLPVVVFTLTVSEPLEGGLGLALVPGLILIATRHSLVIRAWTATGRYAAASPRTVRRGRELLVSGVLGCVAVVVLAAAPPTAADVTAATVIAVGVRHPFDWYDCGIRPWPFGHDLADESADESTGDERESDDGGRCVPDDGATGERDETPIGSFPVDRTVARRLAVNTGITYTVVVGVFLAALLGGMGLVVSGSLSVAVDGVLVGVVAGPVVGFPTGAVCRWLGTANDELRLYEDHVVAYDTLTAEVQWCLSLADVSNVETTDRSVGRRLLGVIETVPFDRDVVQVDTRDGTTRRVAPLIDPAGFVRAVDERRG
ncbi:hypothetical protein RYH80_17130 [Halobaculum sp. MBLA0147]|uniref:hypothetical protein n=1 Tax=Halobaculum sp. MBLA0147 TaxID=3079934 RepID=UPI003525A2DB